jgi:hypothetical protein
MDPVLLSRAQFAANITFQALLNFKWVAQHEG